MIKIRYCDTGDQRRIIIEGHGPGPKGRDIFCAAASALAIALEKNLDVIEHEAKIADGYMEIESAAPQSKLHFLHTVKGFMELAEMYPGQYDVRTI